MFAPVLVGSLAAASGLALALWTSHPSAPLLLVRAEDNILRGATRVMQFFSGSSGTFDEAIVSLSASELKLDKLPRGYRYHPLPYPLPARWDQSDPGRCQLQRWARELPNPKTSVYDGTDTTVDGMYELFLASIEPPRGLDSALPDLLKGHMEARRRLKQLERELRREAGAETAREWQSLRLQAERQSLAIAQAVQAAEGSQAKLYGQAQWAFINDGYRHEVRCGGESVSREPRYTVRESLKEFREAAAARAAVSGTAELLEVGAHGNSAGDPNASLGPAEVAMSFRHLRVFHIQPGEWFSKEALLTFASRLRQGSPKFWGEEGRFQLMPVALLAITEPVLRVKLTGEQARQLREVLAKRQALQVGAFRFDFSKPSSYALVDNGGVRTELEFVAPRGEVVVLGVFSQRPELQQ